MQFNKCLSGHKQFQVSSTWTSEEIQSTTNLRLEMLLAIHAEKTGILVNELCVLRNLSMTHYKDWSKNGIGWTCIKMCVRAVVFKHITVPTYKKNNLVESEQRTSADLLCNAFQHILECYSCSAFVLLTKTHKQRNKKWHPCKVDWKLLISLL